ncbi:IS1 family transposase [Limnobaculum xujianqingii]|uniref:IS1 family transposase n=1 Tax=Limnobaculum xujianqingii TaxID=2738837 RepID=UPI001126AEC1|nr:IS1 family transposase [Limnobaculum xujianqingii]
MSFKLKRTQPICHICGRNDSTKKYGIGKAGQQRYYCMNCGKTFQTTYIYKGKEFNIAAQVEILWEKSHSVEEISTALQVPLVKVKAVVALLEKDNV